MHFIASSRAFRSSKKDGLFGRPTKSPKTSRSLLRIRTFSLYRATVSQQAARDKKINLQPRPQYNFKLLLHNLAKVYTFFSQPTNLSPGFRTLNSTLVSTLKFAAFQTLNSSNLCFFDFWGLPFSAICFLLWDSRLRKFPLVGLGAAGSLYASKKNLCVGGS